ncbi:WD40-repeat-containing domain protein [Fimicolochytrium jonesii]|uniref:WD40-repeat-containing domain protein n=1 Tax=Fimicolochytrium jonesii TaxID=1396493 RepID=UPI0022FED675|nr:WD40-repeat-containing domain protein [Fimicolochytrium jonesii]KAI8816290.1 WD40-repeat-containing domain protein [Fimicolochytrium jonesii]
MIAGDFVAFKYCTVLPNVLAVHLRNSNPHSIEQTHSDTMAAEGNSSTGLAAAAQAGAGAGAAAPKTDVQVQVRFRSRNKRYAVTDTAILVPARLRRYGLSEIINHLLEKTDMPVPFDFLVDGKFLQTSLATYLDNHGLSTETVLELEYVEATLPPTQAATFQHDEWIAAVKGHAGPAKPWTLTGSYDGLARVWDRSGNCKAVLKAHAGAVKAVAWLPSQSEQQDRIITGGQDFKAYGWEFGGEDADVKTKVLFECAGHTGSVDAIAPHPLGEHFATGSFDGNIMIWSSDPTDVEESEEPRKRRKVAKDDDTVETITGVPLKRATKRLTGHTAAVSALTYEHTASSTASLYSGGWDHSVRVWDVEQNTNTWTMGCEKVILAMDHSSFSGLLVTGHSDSVVRLWDPRVQEGLIVKLKLASHTNWVSSVRWSPSSAYTFASASYDGTIKVWDIRSTKPLYTLAAGGEETAKVLSVDWVEGYLLSGGEDAQLRVWTAQA